MTGSLALVAALSLLAGLALGDLVRRLWARGDVAEYRRQVDRLARSKPWAATRERRP